jgi:hypothetical protein
MGIILSHGVVGHGGRLQINTEIEDDAVVATFRFCEKHVPNVDRLVSTITGGTNEQ